MTYPVIGARIVTLSPSFSLSNTLLVPYLSNKLLCRGQATGQLNCHALIYPSFCIFQDILTKEIIGSGTKREGLYYMDDFNISRAHNIHQISNKNRQIWLRRLLLSRHPSFPYLRRLLLSLFSNLHESHRVSYTTNLKIYETPLALIHSDVLGSAPISVSSGIRWFVSIVIDCTCMTWLYLMKHKMTCSEFFTLFMIRSRRNFQLILKFFN